MLNEFLMSKLIEDATLGQKIKSSNDIKDKGKYALDATENNPEIEGTLAYDIQQSIEKVDCMKNTINEIVSLPEGSVAEDGEIAAAKIGPKGEKYDTLQESIAKQIQNYKGIDVSTNTPETKSEVDIWINAKESEEGAICIPEINDDVVSEEDTWSSTKFSSEIKKLADGEYNGINLIKTATTTQAGVVRPDGNSITITEDGIISAKPAGIATIRNVGVVKPDGTTIVIDPYGTIKAKSGKIASTTEAGAVKPDGTTITIAQDGTISSNLKGNINITDIKYSETESASAKISEIVNSINNINNTINNNVYNVCILPDAVGTFTYDGENHSPTWIGFNKQYLRMGGTTIATNAGTYTTTFTPISPYKWSNGSDETREVVWSIKKAEGSINVDKRVIYLNRSANKTDTITVTKAGDGIINVISSNNDIASVSIDGNTITVRGDIAHQGNATLSISVGEGTNHNPTDILTITIYASYIMNAASWADATDDEIEDLLQAHYNGSIDISDYWAIGDKRMMKIDLPNNAPFVDTAISKYVELIIVGFDHDKLKESIGIRDKAAITVMVKSLTNDMIKPVDDDYKLVWNESPVRKWCNNVLVKSFSDKIYNLIKEVKKYTYQYSLFTRYQKMIETIDRGFLMSELEYDGTLKETKNLPIVSPYNKRRSMVSAGYNHTVGLREDGTVFTTGSNTEGQCNVNYPWNKPMTIVAISAGHNHTVGLKSDGTVITAGFNDQGQCNVQDWSNIVAISAGDLYTVGLKVDGTVVATGYNGYGQCNVSDWSNIVAISAGYNHTVGLREDGTVVAVGALLDDRCDVSGWSNIVAISAGGAYTVGLKSDGTVVTVGLNDYGQRNVSGWSNIVAISVGCYYTVGLKADGTVVATGYNAYGQCNVSGWSNIVAISAGYNHTVGLKKDGTVVAVGFNGNGECNILGWSNVVAISAGYGHTACINKNGNAFAIGNYDYGQCNVSGWSNMVSIPSLPIKKLVTTYEHIIGLTPFGYCEYIGDNEEINKIINYNQIFDIGVSSNHTIMVTNSGLCFAIGNNDFGQCDVQDWSNIIAVEVYENCSIGLKRDGTCIVTGARSSANDVSGWSNIKSIKTNGSHTVGLKKDGTVIACGDNRHGQCNISDWSDIVEIAIGTNHTVGLKSDGTVVATGYDILDNRCSGVSDWSDIVTIAAGDKHTIGVMEDGTVVACGDNVNKQCDVESWENITKVYGGTGYTIGYTSNNVFIGTTGITKEYNPHLFELVGWTNIVAITTGDYHTVGLKSDGTCVAAGSNDSGQCNVSDWEDITKIVGGKFTTVGLKKDGTVVVVGNNSNNEHSASNWSDIVEITAGSVSIVGVKSDGTVVDTTGKTYNWTDIITASPYHEDYIVGLKSDGTVVNDGSRRTSDWEDLLILEGNGKRIAGLKSDGTVLNISYSNTECDTSAWSNVISLAINDRHMVGLKKDGTVVATGYNLDGQCNVSIWKLFDNLPYDTNDIYGENNNTDTIYEFNETVSNRIDNILLRNSYFIGRNSPGVIASRAGETRTPTYDTSTKSYAESPSINPIFCL